MKARIKKTGEIVDIIKYNVLDGKIEKNYLDYVEYIDRKGIWHPGRGLNIHLDFEELEEVQSTDIDWEQVRIDTAIKICNSLISNVGDSVFGSDITNKDLAKACVNLSDALISELKKGGER